MIVAGMVLLGEHFRMRAYEFISSTNSNSVNVEIGVNEVKKMISSRDIEALAEISSIDYNSTKFEQQVKKVNGYAKRTCDIVISLLGLIFLFPLTVLISIIIKFDSRGPIIVGQIRCGRDNKRFRIWKFRTVTVSEDSPVVQARHKDLRITRFGRVLRKSSLDELPNLFNVLVGEMSITGPQPNLPYYDDMAKSNSVLYSKRSLVRPGIIGWAQLHGYIGELKTAEALATSVKYDLEYIEQWSFWLEFKMYLKVFEVVFDFTKT
jgi:putative colanic acid biosynthesis UDP-glucose lipid carrier transferase